MESDSLSRPPVRLPTDPVLSLVMPVASMNKLPPEALEHVANYFRTLSEPTRLRVLNVLGTSELSVGEIAQLVDSSVANVSRHLAQMAQHGLVARESRGNSVYYRVSDPTVNELCDLVCGSVARRFDQVASAHAAFVGSAAPDKRRRTN